MDELAKFGGSHHIGISRLVHPTEAAAAVVPGPPQTK
jgi:hypothetical protein